MKLKPEIILYTEKKIQGVFNSGLDILSTSKDQHVINYISEVSTVLGLLQGLLEREKKHETTL